MRAFKSAMPSKTTAAPACRRNAREAAAAFITQPSGRQTAAQNRQRPARLQRIRKADESPRRRKPAPIPECRRPNMPPITVRASKRKKSRARLRQRRHPARAMKIFHHIFSRRLQIEQQRRARRNARETLQRQIDPRSARAKAVR